MGMPEYIAQGSPNSASSLSAVAQPLSRPIAMILTKDSQKSIFGPRRSSILGVQYGFGVFPVTRLYLQHSLDSFLIEAAIDHFLTLGYLPVVIRESDFSALDGVLQPSVSLKAELHEVSIDAYDLFFLRRLSFGGELDASYFRSPASAPCRRHRVRLDESFWKKFGYAPALSYLFHGALKKALAESYRKFAGSFAKRGRAPSEILSADIRPVITYLPTISAPVHKKQLKKLQQSYGFRRGFPYTKFSLSRLVQRGVTLGMEDSKISSAQILGKRTAKYFPPGVRFLQTEIEQLRDADESLRLDLLVALSESTSTGSGFIAKSRCSITVDYRSDVDGYLLVAIEEASAQGVKAFLGIQESARASGKGIRSVSCQPLGKRNVS